MDGQISVYLLAPLPLCAFALKVLGSVKKTGLVDQGMTEKPGEFSKLVQEWDIGVHQFCSVLQAEPKFKNPKNIRPKIIMGRGEIKPSRALCVKGGWKSIKLG